ncbi:4'-phosphopantetheinyl transferase superfamily protein [Frankia sp. CNm7]|uniref:4'-phosphopantetheinyl transferase superfamily protein n=1 Tax=Frankia nepalensis TaxID=1836974 RepID=A0A937R6M3_9ACTN|nr:4'-phosphopantetheinyl transferase superfamily protein [Frankia nepalensis]MBL7497215.1 4'-phosphopantetheinyl transferase superfamily protein [Frankia nepalensis]MBL7510350.1 4'-phosphopantetheinyl transferase superfamily protein [Frankia nepalensis]MBL7522694.1 4'-phosphopantetheinyl transferase superfamily protein [Frankia nepalensis]MBL7626688.1 4'-phosphopantetheinyl transferase superfamily protein [Frankia nepalensis]
MAELRAGVEAGLLGSVVPAAAVAVETFTDDLEAVLFPAEEALLARAVEKRRREFTTGRVCARRALTRLGVAPGPLLPGPQREPLWPAGIVGSITHTDGYRAAVVAWDRDLVSVGIDAEPNGPTPEGVFERVSLPSERAWADAAARRAPEVHWDRLLFCAKESVYKTWFPLARRWLGFEEAEITLTDDGTAGAPGTTAGVPGTSADAARAGTARTGGFSARLLVPGPTLPDGTRLTTLAGRFVVDRGLIVTAITLGEAA